ncbi:LIVCS family branched-chain amino acid:cation transporter [Arcanobacterium wilhelmae]|uniref:LIVCS family branched-chain amino acid:cation transporter n=1 Tax=Arcanobacterium wilhelmae TaxID=1803177 RepID=A0ABT9NC31_9ACTO|nr:branched-chain amino acid transport system II carrier protein [Arcanobacterium wilhelmae]MDP9801278.1 LIVCS family branched-chain amino acid:cation transporter [Arcanobacterium wilhelmae]WFN90624.1 branched-chain amino acid transport system II carrier protein [Arcanobacterium wilhelmae]
MTTHMRSIVIAAFALFAMFFGAGNLILPAMIGVNGGGSAYVGATGFVITGAALTVAGMLAASTLRPGETRIADRIGPRFGLIFTSALYLAIGMLYPTPRVAAVSFEIAIAPWTGSGQLALFLYTLVFFGACYLLVRRPHAVVGNIGGWLTPALIVLLVVMVVMSFTLPDRTHVATGVYATSPFAAGLIEGYFTMDSLATLMYGSVIMAALASAGLAGEKLRRGTALASVIAGVLLAACYFGLINVGAVGEGKNGAEVITGVAARLFGTAGQAFFGAMIILACMTTAIGLLASGSRYWHELIPSVSAHTWLLVHLVAAVVISNLGLEAILAVVAPICQLLYPVTICLIVVALIESAMRSQLAWAYRLPAWVAGALSVLEALNSTGLALFAPLRAVLDVFPLGSLQMAWVVPALVALGAGLAADVVRSRRAVSAE